MENKTFLEYEFTSDVLCIGERTKKGTYKPCVKTIPYSSITYALRSALGRSDIHAVGMFDKKYLQDIDRFREILVYSPRNRYEDVSKVPLNIEYLINPTGRVYVFYENGSCPAEDYFAINMGAFRSKGFGKCALKLKWKIENPPIDTGTLLTRVPEARFDIFGITNVAKPVYGYLFEPKDISTGKYVRSVFEGSIISGYNFLLEKERYK